jgi:biopolymer transport protein ExbD
MKTSKRKISADVLIIPAADILLAGMFFMLIAGSLIQIPAVSVALPGLEAEALVDGGSPIVTLTPGGGIFLDGRRVSREGLAMILELSARISDSGEPGPALVIRADRDVSYSELVEIIEIAGAAGIARAALAVRKK